MNVHTHPAPKRSTSGTGSTPVAGGGQPPYDESMEKRIADLETTAVKSDERFARIELRLDRIDTRLDQMATKDDLANLRDEMVKGFVEVEKGFVEVHKGFVEVHKGFADSQKSHSDTLKAVISAILGLGAVGIAALTLLMAYLAPKQTPVATQPSPQPPIIIQLPAPSTAVPAVPLPAQPQR
jgi:hypothetical protein